MDTKRLIELAIEALEAKNEAIEREIRALRKGAAKTLRTIGEGRTRTAAGARVATGQIKRRKRSVAARKAQAEKMRAYWAKRKAEATKKTRKSRKGQRTKTKATTAAPPVPF
jgi:hypothetical protein